MLTEILSIIGAFILSMACGIFFIPTVLKFCKKKKLYDIPTLRKVHGAHIPRLGGIAFIPSMMISAVAVLLIITTNNIQDKISLSMWSVGFILSLSIIYSVGIIDESFVDFSEDFQNNSLLHNDILEAYPNMTVIKSISKSYGVPGLRLGVLASSDTTIINRIKKEVSIWNINSFGEYYMQIFGKYSKNYIKACEAFIKERERFQQEMTKIDFIRVIPSQANYFMIKLIDKYSPEELSAILLKKHNILIKSCNGKHGLENKNYVRIAVRSKNDNDLLLQALKELAYIE